MEKVEEQQIALPARGLSRFGDFANRLPFSRETFRKLSLEKKAPQPLRMGVRCTFYRNEDIIRFLADPLGFVVEGEL